MSGRKQFDVDVALGQAMTAFWERGFAATSLDVLSAATGLGRGSLYGTYGSKDGLFRQALQRYADHYGARYDAALEAQAGEPVAAVRAFFAVTLARIVDPDVPTGCLLAQSAAEAAILSAESRDFVQAQLRRQNQRVRTALVAGGLARKEAEELTSLVVAVNQSLAVLSRSGTSPRELRTVVRATCTAVQNVAEKLAAEGLAPA
ncbi:TetR/AcrR family transcriptional regulator [Actinospica durhamensis]|uniref:TetR/AcrR family transcriptional regulator n=1 Tax=Actinospica durhamensis TaxID=1508375 RepID=A0A941EPE1_9ACTN|nr:TetR/AcrR family transcriptional regulator [Actinospica durhamensis]MBR7834668.1 TetR/AcrR family transcriptional regulator [Actinospica durhamensis]